MSSFITPNDYDASIHAEILDAITRSDPAVIEMAEDMAIEDMKGYLNERYDVDTIFLTSGNSRPKLLVMFCIDMVLYHLHSAHNPQRFPDIRKERYKRAIEWLSSVQKGTINPTGLTLKTNDDGSKGSLGITISSNPKRITRY